MDPATLSLSSIGATALTEGIKFLYSQAGELLKEWRKHRSSDSSDKFKSIPARLPDVFDGQLKDPQVNLVAVSNLEPQLRTLYGELAEYGNGISPVDMTDNDILRKVSALRDCIERALGQRITFKGELRESTGATIVGSVTADTVHGQALGVELDGAPEADVSGMVKATVVSEGGIAIGVRLNR